MTVWSLVYEGFNPEQEKRKPSFKGKNFDASFKFIACSSRFGLCPETSLSLTPVSGTGQALPLSPILGGLSKGHKRFVLEGDLYPFLTTIPFEESLPPPKSAP